MKTCAKCKTEYPATIEYFPPDKQAKDKLGSWCRKCCRKANQEYNRTEKGKIAHKKYRQTLTGHLRNVYAGIKYRCGNLKCKAYNCYGGRGIKNKFKSVGEFVDYVVDTLQVDPRGLQMDRINNNGHYEKDNIRFVTAKVNCNNRRKRGNNARKKNKRFARV